MSARVRGILPVAWSATLAVFLLWPQRLGGYGLGHDLVFTPRQPPSWASIGLGSSAPRAVPVDAVVALLSKIADGAVVGRVALVVPLLAAGLGAARLVGHDRMLGALAACGFAIWNPFVIERLALGQWALLWAYGALPWIVRSAARLRDGSGRPWPLLLWVAAASITPTGGVIAAVVGAVVAFPANGDGRRRWFATVAGLLALQLPWVLPSVVGSAQATSDPGGVAAFAARSEHAGGAVVSLLGTGGIWDVDVVPDSRSGPLAFVALAVIAAAAVVGWPRLVRILGGTTAVRLAACAAVGFVLAAAASVPGLSAVMRWIVRTVPGGGLLRDAQKWLMPYTLLVVLLLGAAVARLAVFAAWRVAVAAVAVAGPLVLLPDAKITGPARSRPWWRRRRVAVPVLQAVPLDRRADRTRSGPATAPGRGGRLRPAGRLGPGAAWRGRPSAQGGWCARRWCVLAARPGSGRHRLGARRARHAGQCARPRRIDARSRRRRSHAVPSAGPRPAGRTVGSADHGRSGR